jgi:lipooligosaccharide transport system ATP-binding protein
MPVRPAVVLRGVVKRFGSTTAVDHLDLQIPIGTCFGLLGPNGAGKSTVMSLLIGSAVADQGVVEVLGLPVPARARGARARTGLVPQLDNLDGEITCRDNLDVFARLYGVAKGDRDAAVQHGLAIAQLAHKADSFVEELSGGMRRRLLIARGLIHRPELVLMDEPTVGLDPQIRQELWATIGAVRETGATVVLTTHYIEEAERLCDVVAVVHHGRLLALGSPAQLIRDHVGTDVVVEVHGDAARQRRVAEAADAAGIVHRAAGTSVALFSDTVDGLDHPVDIGDLEHRTRRPANLEDVFVILTGATL